MKHFAVLLFISCSSEILISQNLNWNTVGGNSLRNGRVDFNGPVGAFEIEYRAQSLPTIWEIRSSLMVTYLLLQDIFH
ncbi:MAG: hypothetical protein IPG99_18200 [Ignavibacteria bacterium]|nr:hypothetical protein [Ignavibacteria bacterium]